MCAVMAVTKTRNTSRASKGLVMSAIPPKADIGHVYSITSSAAFPLAASRTNVAGLLRRLTAQPLDFVAQTHLAGFKFADQRIVVRFVQ